MPITKSAQKKLRQDKKRKTSNAVTKAAYKSAIKKAGKLGVSKASSAIDKAAKKGLIHKNKAARLKSRIAKAK